MDANFDEFIKQVEQDELEDQVDAVMRGEVTAVEQTKMTVIDYAKARGIAPQNVYYYIRTGRISQEKCICGRYVIDIVSAETFFTELEKKRAEKRGGIVND